jgi:hypothetical protein
LKHAILTLTAAAVIGACDPMTEPITEAEIVDVSLPHTARPTDDLIALECGVFSCSCQWKDPQK